MKALFDDRQRAHEPRHFLANGVVRPNPEQSERIRHLLDGADVAGCGIVAPQDFGQGPLAAVHTAEYLRFLRTIHDRWIRQDGAGQEVIPNVHPRSRSDSYPDGMVGQAGYHMADTACPIGADTWLSAYWSAQTAVSAAQHLITGQDTGVYALCRPPGHHAYQDQAGGFCFLNNTAIAAQWLRDRGHRVAILDVDVHHGNGTQGIFYDRGDVLTVSVHADPIRFYPFFWGRAAERGQGAGLGFNLNLPLPRGTGDAGVLAALSRAFEQIRDFGATHLVVALGLDAHEGDPFQALKVTTDGFHRMGGAIAEQGLPTLFVQEGGYLSADLGRNLTAVLTGFEGR